jgi:hypothetical protein
LSITHQRSLPLAVALLAAATATARAQSVAAPDTLSGAGPSWSYYATAYVYIIRNEDDLATGVVWADRGRLHLEARYNYEDLDTGSLWAGFNLDGGGTVSWELTLMAGAAFGATDGIAPGYRGVLYWKAFDLWSEGEYLFDSGDRADNFSYTWTELAWSRAWFRTGVAVQRTRVYQTDAEVERGGFAGGTWSAMEASVYLFEPGSDKAAVMLLAGVSF